METNLRKFDYSGWKAETFIKSDKEGFEFKISTYKTQEHGIQTVAQEVKRSGNMIEFELYNPKYRFWRALHGEKRATEKAIKELNDKGIKLFFEAFPQLKPIEG